VISEPRVIAHLVHGTWPAGGFLAHRYPRIFKPQPVWIDEGSDFRRDVEARVPGIEWRPFRWSGENSELDRRRAAMSFADMLRRELDSAQDACHVVIAHSHGGNVALWGLGHLDQASRNRVAGFATMGTPFLHFESRPLSALEAVYLKLLLDGQFVILISLVAPVVAGAQFAFRDGLLTEGVLMAALSVGGLILGYVQWRKVRKQPAELELLKPVWPERLRSFVALRSRADEASRVIALGDAAGRIFVSAWVLMRILARLMPWNEAAWRRRVTRAMIAAVGALSAVTMLSATFGPATELHALPAWQYWLVLIVLIPMAFAFLMFLLALSLAVFPFAVAMAIFAYSQPFLGLAFGADTFHLAIATEIAAEASPPRPAPVLEHVDPGDAGTRHSLHAMPAARLRLAAWIRERRDAFVQAPV